MLIPFLLLPREYFVTHMSSAVPLSFPLVDSSYDNEEILRCIETLLSGHLTMGERVKEFELAFAAAVGAPYAVMVNSGSSANLLAFAAITNSARRDRLSPGQRVGVPAVCWSTSVWPIVQMGLVPVLLDVEPGTLNLSIPALRAALASGRLDAVMMVHVLGNSTDVGELLALSDEHGFMIIEDTCESLGSRYGDKWLGTLGAFGTFSFYFSHHMTTIEGGMVVAHTEDDVDLLRCLRSHGWSREQSNRMELERNSPNIDPRFLFINVGYNLRPMEIQAAFGLEQIQRLDTMNMHRRANVAQMREAFRAHAAWEEQLRFPEPTPGLDPCWFGFPFLVDPSVPLDYAELTRKLLAKGIDTRPIVSGNMALQPVMQRIEADLGQGPFVGAQLIHDRGLFMGAHAKAIDESRVAALVDAVLGAL